MDLGAVSAPTIRRSQSCNYNPKLGQVSTDGIDHRGLLADEELAGAMQHQATLLFRRLGLDEPHIGPCDCFADRLRVSGIILVPLDVGLHIGRRHQTHGMAKRQPSTASEADLAAHKWKS
jgi:hypothetical protein